MSAAGRFFCAVHLTGSAILLFLRILPKPCIIHITISPLCSYERAESKERSSSMKSSSMNTHMGNISIDNEVIAQYAGSVAMECFGIVGMAGINVRDGVFSLLKKESMTRGINVSLTPEGKLVIDFHVIVSYGVNIPTVADNLIDSVRYKVEEFTGLEIEKMNVFVEGVKVID